MQLVKNYGVKFVAFICAALFAGCLLDSAGMDTSKANILRYDTFSIATLVIFGVCFHWAYSLLLFFAKKMKVLSTQQGL